MLMSVASTPVNPVSVTKVIDLPLQKKHVILSVVQVFLSKAI